MNILIVEDDLLAASQLQLDLEEGGHKVTDKVRSVREALRSFRSHTPDLIILDISLGSTKNRDGIALADLLGELGNTPYIYLSGHCDLPTMAEAGLTRPYAFVTKPYYKEQLLMQVKIAYDRFLESNQSADPVRSPESLYLHVNSRHVRISFDDLLFVQANRRRVFVHTLHTGEAPHAIGTHLGDVAHFFVHPDLIRLPPSLIVNRKHLREIRDHLAVIGDKELKLSASARKMLLEALHVVKTKSKNHHN